MGDLKGAGPVFAILIGIGLVLAPPVDFILDLLCVRALIKGVMGRKRLRVIFVAMVIEIALPTFLFFSAPEQMMYDFLTMSRFWKFLFVYFFCSGIFKAVVLIRVELLPMIRAFRR